MIFHPIAGGPCWADCCNFLHNGWHPRCNARVPNFKSIASGVTELRWSKFGVFLFTFEPLLQQCYALPCYTVILRTDRPTSHFLEKFEWPYLGNGNPIHFMFFLGRVFEVGESSGPISGWTKSKMAASRRPAAILENFE